MNEQLVKKIRGNKELQERLRRLRVDIAEHATALPAEERADRIAKSRADKFFFYTTYFPHHFEDEPAEIHPRMVEESLKPGINTIAAPRGSAKTTLVTQLETLRQIYIVKEPFQVIIGESQEVAVEKAAVIKVEMENNVRLRNDFGDLNNRGTWEEGDFTTNTGCRVIAIGRRQPIRGRKFGAKRPGRIVGDDIEDDESVRNPRITEQLYDWILRAVYPSLDPKKGSLTILGTMLSKRSALAKLVDNPEVNSVIFRAIEKGKSFWSSRFTVPMLNKIKKLVGIKVWLTEYMNDPQDDENAPFKTSWFKRYKPRDLKRKKLHGPYVACDPSLEANATSDFKGIAAVWVEKTKDGPIYYVKPWVRRESLGRFYRRIYEINDKYKPSLIGLETETWQKLMYNEIKSLEAKYGIRLPLRGIRHGGQSKVSRIMRLAPAQERGEIRWLNDDPDTDECIMQFVELDKPGVHDDGPDAVEMAITLAEREARKISGVRALGQ